MYYHNITHCDMLNGPGLRTVLWVSGCNHHCKGCHNPETWDCNSGIPFDDAAKDELLSSLADPYISGVTFSGGDPLHPNNRSTVLELAGIIKSQYPDKDIILYTGYAWDEICSLPELSVIDFLIDEEFKEDLFDSELYWVGSSNQHIIDVKKSLGLGDMCLAYWF